MLSWSPWTCHPIILIKTLRSQNKAFESTLLKVELISERMLPKKYKD